MAEFEHWLDVGVHPTPEEITNQFALATVGFWDSGTSTRSTSGVRLVDLFCGDGRLGRAVSELLEASGNPIRSSYVEVDRGRFGMLLKSEFEAVEANVFTWEPDVLFDLVVCNPPYQMLTVDQSRSFGIPWEKAKRGGRNLYCISILRALELCRPGGLVGVVAPFGWLRGVQARSFRAQVAGLCSRVVVVASRERDRFGGPRQDTAFQFFYRRGDSSTNPASCTFSYEDSHEPTEIDLLDVHSSKPVKGDWRVRVGPSVWNRQISALTSSTKDAYVLVYGGNIREGSDLDLSVSRYRHKQYIKRSAVSCSDLTHGPAILFRRTLRGRPGEWSVDSVAINDDFSCVAENHVICVELPGYKNSLHKLHDDLVRDVREHYELSGSPNISAEALKQFVSRRVGNRMCVAATG